MVKIFYPPFYTLKNHWGIRIFGACFKACACKELFDLEDLVVMNKVWYLALPVDRLATHAHRLGHGGGTAGEHANLADIAMLLLHKLQEATHVRTAKVVDGL